MMPLIILNKSQPNAGCVTDLDELSMIIFICRNGKCSGVEGLHPKVIKKGESRLVQVVNATIRDTEENIEFPADWKDAQLVTIFKKKDIRDSDN